MRWRDLPIAPPYIDGPFALALGFAPRAFKKARSVDMGERSRVSFGFDAEGISFSTVTRKNRGARPGQQWRN